MGTRVEKMNKLNIEDIERLIEQHIELKYGNLYQKEFKLAEGNSRKQKKFWKRLAGKFEQDFSGRCPGDKYNQLVIKYRPERSKSDESGAPPSTRVYRNLFNNTSPNKPFLEMDNTLELRSEKEEINEVKNQCK